MEASTPLHVPITDGLSLDFLVELGIVDRSGDLSVPVVPITLRTTTGLHVVSLEEQLGDLMEQTGLSVADIVGVEIPEPPAEEPEEETEDFAEISGIEPVRGRSFGYGFGGPESIQPIQYYNYTDEKVDLWDSSLQNSKHIPLPQTYEHISTVNLEKKKFAQPATILGALVLKNFLEKPESETIITLNEIILPERLTHKTLKSMHNNIESHTYTRLESV